ncbi:NnrS family protein [Halomonas llamarensis]|uniref:NnrS family protein n=1 Tax=Halomonas llamarensis TaxID=2945104 RepID=A0ABT0SMQ7_9GAMM|nr:NnrS family protein [Halomonas llamarensis]MCL7928699.1 NnrS family protein [Halomonas llamarensis]
MPISIFKHRCFTHLGFRHPWLAYGFRPFFLLGALYAPIALVPWVGALLQQFTLPMALSPLAWHGHEMLFGFVSAALVGFLLTSIPSWAGVSPLAGKPLAALVVLWLAGRVVFWCSALLPGLLVALVNLAFPLVLLAWALPALVSDAGRKHLSIGFALCGYILVQTLFYVAWLWPALIADLSPVSLLNTAVNVLLVLIALTATRIIRVVAMAARSELGLSGPGRLTPAREHLALAVLVLFVVADLFAPGHAVTGWIALAAAAAQADRLSEWPWGRAMGRLYLLLLTLAYLWMVVGLALVGLTALTDSLPGYAGRHALSAGAAGTAILAVFCIAGLRHTGRSLSLPKLIWPGLVALSATVLLRTFVPVWWPEYYLLAGVGLPFLLWLVTYLLYLIAYGRFLVTDRADGLPG